MDQEKNVSVNQAGGQLKIADDVIAIIAGLAISDQKGIEKAAKKGRNKGITIRMEEGQVVCDVELTIVQGTKIPKMAAEVQEKIKTAVETMTGLAVKQVNVNIVNMNMEKTAKEA
ncbi:MAG: Asp23/Gls24 family envelope stress response protein [Firmicutes bacterium]|nr:Asp23/Gls24 family envelope stress response protein [Bacillota bacterium]MBR6683093.1 Asp23/Gls24 family envelope stress response protein [Bacillota bacterium]